jgi:rhodanese-related sulfurtransferase
MLKTENCTICDVNELRNVLNEPSGNVIAIDVRTKGEFKSSSIEGVQNIPLDDIKKHLVDLKKYDKVYVHCHNGTRTEEACRKLSKEGINSVIVQGGIVSWKKAGYPVKSASSGEREVISLQRQVQITAGSLILLGVILSKTFNPEFIYLAGIMGAGLLFTGISGSCMMARVLTIMPWNK